MAGRAPEVALAAVLPVAVGRRTLLVEAQAAHLLPLGKIGWPNVQADTHPLGVLVDDTVADVHDAIANVEFGEALII